MISLHNHFESQYDTANNLSAALTAFSTAGFTKVGVTDHGVFSSFEDLQSLIRKKEIPLELIPGVEGYFSLTVPTEEELQKGASPPTAEHILLLAKDYTGYQSLCRIITQSSKGFYKRPTITLENLRKNVAKGHLVCTTACIAGIFTSHLGFARRKMRESLTTEKAKVETIPYDRELLLTKEEFQEPWAKPLKTLTFPLYDKDTEIHSLSALRKQKIPTDDLDLLAYRIYVSGANKAILDYLRKEKKPKAHNGQINQTALTYFEKRKEVYERLKDITPCKVRKSDVAKFLSLYQSYQSYPGEEEELRFLKDRYREFIRIFGKENFYFEIQNHGLEEEAILYNALVSFAKEMKNEDHFIVANDIHIMISPQALPQGITDFQEYLHTEVIKRDIISFTRINGFFHHDDTISPDSYEYYIKDDDSLRTSLSSILPEEIVENGFANLYKVGEECHVVFPEKEDHYPQFGDDDVATFKAEIQKGIIRRFPDGFPDKKVYEASIAMEEEVITSMGYASYFLIVQDYIRYGRLLGNLPESLINSPSCPMSVEAIEEYMEAYSITPNAYSIGPGRGSAAGSEIAFLMGITDIDPIPYGLYFERFLNPSRVTMPDVDTDFSLSVREACIRYVRHKYGSGNCAYIFTKTYAGFKQAIRIVARYQGTKDYLAYIRSEGETYQKDRLKEFLRPYYRMADNLSKQYTDVEEDKTKLITTTLAEQKLVTLAGYVEGCFTTYGEHAAGVIISKDVISDSLPIGNQNGDLALQCSFAQAEDKGYLKMDFLGLNNLDILTACMRSSGDYSLLDEKKKNAILQDKAIYKHIYAKGLTQGVFQMESYGMKSFLKELQPDCFEDIVLMNAAYRPGPMQFLPEIIAEKRYRNAIKEGGRIMEDGSVICIDETVLTKPEHSITIDNPVLQSILNPTYGCIIYQEQIMQICNKVAGFSMAEADNVRRYMSKKKTEELVALRPKFVKGCEEISGICEEEANLLFDTMIEFAKYAFNIAHALCYAVISVYTAYYKYYHPGVFFAESINAIKKLKELQDFLQELSAFSLTFHPPRLGYSKSQCTAYGTDIYCGISTMKGIVSLSFTEAQDMTGFLINNYQTIGVKVMQKLAMVGFFEGIARGVERSDLCCFIEEGCAILHTIDKVEEKIDDLKAKRIALHDFLQKERTTAEEKAAMLELIKSRKQNPDKKYFEGRFAKLEQKQLEYSNERQELVTRLHHAYLYCKERHTTPDIKAYREAELTLFGTVFSIADSMEAISYTLPMPREVVTEPVANVGIVILNPHVKVTPGGWHKTLVCDKTGEQFYLYFDEDVSAMKEAVLTILPPRAGDDGHYFPVCYEVKSLQNPKHTTIFLSSMEDVKRLGSYIHEKKNNPQTRKDLAAEEVAEINVFVGDGFKRYPAPKTTSLAFLKSNHMLYELFE